MREIEIKSTMTTEEYKRQVELLKEEIKVLTRESIARQIDQIRSGDIPIEPNGDIFFQIAVLAKNLNVKD